MIEQCVGCENCIGDGLCSRYADAQAQHKRYMGCAMRTHNRTQKEQQRLSTDSIKVSKRKAGVK